MPRPPAISGRILNRNEMAGDLGISVSTLDRWVLSGCPVQGRSENRREYQFNSADVIAWHEQRKAARTASDDNDGKRRHQLAAAELKELQLAEKRKVMISVEDVAPIIADELANVRSRLMAIPGRLAPALVGLDHAAIELKIRDEVIGALSELTGTKGV